MKYFALIPAAGYGTRLSAQCAKQYLPLLGRPMLYYSIRRFCADPKAQRVYIVLAPDDKEFMRYDWEEFTDKLRPLYCGGQTRAISVLNGLTAINDDVTENDWILVHDAARPCLTAEMIDKLVEELSKDKVGGLLALPVADTLKRSDHSQRVIQTERRENIWQAQTPQMFRYKLLCNALQSMNGAVATDEARAVENLELQPKLVVGDSRNLKVTYPQDLEMAQLILLAMNKQ